MKRARSRDAGIRLVVGCRRVDYDSDARQGQTAPSVMARLAEATG
jgi:hypothetical protein